MHPEAAAAAVAGAAGAAMDRRAAARVIMTLGVAMAAMAILAANINVGVLHAPSQNNGVNASPAPAPGEQQCAATEVDALNLRGPALFLVLTGVAQVVAAGAADVAVAGSMGALGRCLAASAYIIAGINARLFCHIVHAAAVVTFGHCAVKYVDDLIWGYIIVAVSYLLLIGVSFAVTFF